MTDDVDLDSLNHALRELNRLRLAREIPLAEALETRRTLLQGAEASWRLLAAPQVGNDATLDEVLPEAADEAHAQLIDQLRAFVSPEAIRRLATDVPVRLIRDIWHLSLWAILLFVTLGMLYYISTL